MQHIMVMKTRGAQIKFRDHWDQITQDNIGTTHGKSCGILNYDSSIQNNRSGIAPPDSHTHITCISPLHIMQVHVLQ